jgi:hypothetical protein
MAGRVESNNPSKKSFYQIMNKEMQSACLKILKVFSFFLLN